MNEHVKQKRLRFYSTHFREIGLSLFRGLENPRFKAGSIGEKIIKMRFSTYNIIGRENEIKTRLTEHHNLNTGQMRMLLKG